MIRFDVSVSALVCSKNKLEREILELFSEKKISDTSIPLQCCKNHRKRIDEAPRYGFVDSLIYIIAKIPTRCTYGNPGLASNNAVITTWHAKQADDEKKKKMQSSLPGRHHIQICGDPGYPNAWMVVAQFLVLG